MYAWHQQVKESAVEHLQRAGENRKERKATVARKILLSARPLWVSADISFLHPKAWQKYYESSMTLSADAFSPHKQKPLFSYRQVKHRGSTLVLHINATCRKKWYLQSHIAHTCVGEVASLRPQISNSINCSEPQQGANLHVSTRIAAFSSLSLSNLFFSV